MPTRREVSRLVASLLTALALPAWGRRARAAAPVLWRCTNADCDPYIYDAAIGDPDNIAGDGPIPPGTRFEDLPDTWLCPNCGEPKASFIRHHPL